MYGTPSQSDPSCMKRDACSSAMSEEAVNTFLTQKREKTYSDTVEESVGIFFVLLKYSDVLEDLLLDLDALVEPDRVFTEEVEDEEIGWLQGNMFATQGTAADSIGFIFTLLVTSTECKLVNEVHRRRTLPVSHDLRSKLNLVVLPDAIDMILDCIV